MCIPDLRWEQSGGNIPQRSVKLLVGSWTDAWKEPGGTAEFRMAVVSGYWIVAAGLAVRGQADCACKLLS